MSTAPYNTTRAPTLIGAAWASDSPCNLEETVPLRCAEETALRDGKSSTGAIATQAIVISVASALIGALVGTTLGFVTYYALN